MDDWVVFLFSIEGLHFIVSVAQAGQTEVLQTFSKSGDLRAKFLIQLIVRMQPPHASINLVIPGIRF